MLGFGWECMQNADHSFDLFPEALPTLQPGFYHDLVVIPVRIHSEY
ncbi:MAG: hypothetical protein BWY82_02212 [Verrucomicrobia bacterium ADurb.Bin474]|nr:MAG: hypothetical protein BWY82_02212 [Verrucomicrobia bacterium ADurb.Bin474]